MKKILFITPYAFNEINGGSVLFKKLFKEIKIGQLDWFICSDWMRSPISEFKFGKIYPNYNLLLDNPIFNSFARKFSWFGLFFFYLKYKIYSVSIQKKLSKKIIETDIDFLWIYLSHSSISTSAGVIKKNRLKYHLSIQDDVHTHLPSFESRFLKEDFKFLIENANSIDFISDKMYKYYCGIYDIKAKTTTFLIGDNIDVAPPLIKHNIEKIGFAGNIWCRENFICLLESIRNYNSASGSNIKLVVYTCEAARGFFESYGGLVEFHRMIPYEQLLTELQKCDLLYLPMSFKLESNITNQTSFPSKIITYLNSGVPLLNHSPVLSVSHEFIESKEIGYSITTCETNEFEYEFNRLIQGDHYQMRSHFSNSSVNALRIFDPAEMITKLQGLIISSFK